MYLQQTDTIPPVIFLIGTMICKRKQRPQRYIIGHFYNIWTKNAYENSTS